MYKYNIEEEQKTQAAMSNPSSALSILASASGGQKRMRVEGVDNVSDPEGKLLMSPEFRDLFTCHDEVVVDICKKCRKLEALLRDICSCEYDECFLDHHQERPLSDVESDDSDSENKDPVPEHLKLTCLVR